MLSCVVRALFPPGATSLGERRASDSAAERDNVRYMGESGCSQYAQRQSKWSLFRIALWALRVIVLGTDVWKCIASKANLALFNNSKRKRRLHMLPAWLM